MERPDKAPQRQARQQRLSRALRENLKRRKVQSRGRAVSTDGAESPAEPAEEADSRLSPQSRPD